MQNTIDTGRALRFKLVRTSLDLSQNEFGKELEIAQNYVSAIEKAKRNITSRIISKLEIKFNINPNWLLSNNGEMYLSNVDKLNVSEDELRELLKNYEKLDENKRILVKGLVDELISKK